MSDEKFPEDPSSSIEEVLKEIKKEVLQENPSDSAQERSLEALPKPQEQEIENLKKVLHEADAQADVSIQEVQGREEPQNEQRPDVDFNENFLKLEKLLKELKKQP